MFPQAFIPTAGTLLAFGPDGSSGLLPIPHVLAYYAIFFGFGALYFGYDDRTGRVGGAGGCCFRSHCSSFSRWGRSSRSEGLGS